jgi:hypothetical protein
MLPIDLLPGLYKYVDLVSMSQSLTLVVDVPLGYVRWQTFKRISMSNQGKRSCGDDNVKPGANEGGGEVEWKKRSRDMTSAKEKKHEKERVDIHPYMNVNHITYVLNTFIDRNDYLPVSKFFRYPVATHGHLC